MIKTMYTPASDTVLTELDQWCRDTCLSYAGYNSRQSPSSENQVLEFCFGSIADVGLFKQHIALEH